MAKTTAKAGLQSTPRRRSTPPRRRVGAPHHRAGASPLRVGALHCHSHHPVALDKGVAQGVDVRVEDRLGQHLESLGRLLAVGAESLNDEGMKGKNLAPRSSANFLYSTTLAFSIVVAAAR